MTNVSGTPEEPIDGRARYGAGFSVQASDAVEAVGRAREVFQRAAAAAGLPQWALARVEAQTERELELELARPSFPEPVARLKATPVWTADSVRRFLDAWPRKAGRPPASTRQQAG